MISSIIIERDERENGKCRVMIGRQGRQGCSHKCAAKTHLGSDRTAFLVAVHHHCDRNQRDEGSGIIIGSRAFFSIVSFLFSLIALKEKGRTECCIPMKSLLPRQQQTIKSRFNSFLHYCKMVSNNRRSNRSCTFLLLGRRLLIPLLHLQSDRRHQECQPTCQFQNQQCCR